ncbi:chitooligosaccharidolytic beta-N-acetylglucosaminidase-like [Penaeus japonicus]|uniref:chitooligosaccharidolytic beta-N-acetylglucosaminidase-like n=1 Tax=Penaeus japonicus TaxID=27405 RepID=UPI001C70D0DD|nr:chitooligosaccharidolytic beta-N-acetylglucosaminidase-like [Penaeus japonicus]
MEGVSWRRETTLVLLMGVLAPLLLPPGVSATFSLPSPWGWACVNETCVKQENSGMRTLPGLNTCKLTCGPFGSLWPRPTGVTRIGNETMNFLLEKISLEGIRAPSEVVRNFVTQAFGIFKNNLAKELPGGDHRPEAMGPHHKEVLNREVRLDITVSGAATRLTLETPEAYTLDITPRGTIIYVTILASNYFGARHALETLSQLIAFDDHEGLLQIVSSVALTDTPAFKYRGILLDTSRNFFSVKSIERTLDAMAANKLNTFHWHITDSHSFPMFLQSLPKMAYYGAYSSRQVYLPTDIMHLVEYGRVRGIRVLPEFDAPAHVGSGWEWGEADGLGKLAVCLNKESWQSYCLKPPCGQLNVVNDNMYTVLGQIYREMVSLFGPLDLFHFGGDEVNLNCWNTTEEIVSYMEEQGRGRDANAYYKLWSDFQASAYGHLTTANKGRQIPGILWTSHLTEEGRADQYLDKDHYIIQIKTKGKDKLIGELLQKRFRVIFSNSDHWYLDSGFTANTSYKGWQTVYDNSPHAIATDLTGSPQADLILGERAVYVSEQDDEMSLDSKVGLCPSVATRSRSCRWLWTNLSYNQEPRRLRFIHQRQRMVTRGDLPTASSPSGATKTRDSAIFRSSFTVLNDTKRQPFEGFNLKSSFITSSVSDFQRLLRSLQIVHMSIKPERIEVNPSMKQGRNLEEDTEGDEEERVRAGTMEAEETKERDCLESKQENVREGASEEEARYVTAYDIQSLTVSSTPMCRSMADTYSSVNEVTLTFTNFYIRVAKPGINLPDLVLLDVPSTSETTFRKMLNLWNLELLEALDPESWQSYCLKPPCGQLNVVNDNMYTVLGQIYREMVSLFGPLDLFHFGGDEVNLNCWNTTEEIVSYMEEQGRGRDANAYYKLWSDFQASAYGHLTTANKGRQIPGILWTSHLTEEGRADQYLDKDHYIIQIKTKGKDKLIGELLQKRFRVIFSNSDHWYLDSGFTANTTYKGWQTVYDNSPHAIATDLTGSPQADLILGGEAAMWSEQVDEMSLDSKLWPRGAALAERLWTNPSHNWEPAETRFIHQRQRMVTRGIQADRIQPQWCHQNEGLCYI